MRLLRKKSNYFITCSGKKDGAGAQALATLSTMLFARDAGLHYVHTPFKHIQHNPDGDPVWEKKWEAFFGFWERRNLPR
jgi:hypothetical protein